MAIDLQQVINSPHTVRLVSAVARLLPPRIAHPACDRIGQWAASRRESPVTRAVRINQWMARGAALDGKTLDGVVRETLQNNVRDLYELYHHLGRYEAMRRRICLNPLAEELVRRPAFGDRGLVIVGVHLSSFDSVLLSMIHQGFSPLVLTIPDPQGGRRVEFEMRQRTGMNIVPASLEALRQATQHLKRGGMVLTGIDRPIANPRLQPRFFGQPAPLPTHHIFLALKARVPLVLMAAVRQTDGKINVFSSEILELEQHADHEQAIVQNAEMVLSRAEDLIRLAPQQWNVPLPVWPELIDKVPD